MKKKILSLITPPPKRPKEQLEAEVVESVQKFEKAVGGEVRTLRLDTEVDLDTGEVIRSVEVDVR